MDGIGIYSRTMGGKSSKIPGNKLLEQVDCILFALIMTYITDQENVFGIKEVVVFEISRDQGLHISLTGIFQKKATGAPTNSYFLYWLVSQLGMSDYRGFHHVFKEM